MPKADNNRGRALSRLALISTWLVCALILGGSVWFFLIRNYFEAAVALTGLVIVMIIQFGTRPILQLRNPPGMQLAVSGLALVSLFAGRLFRLYRTVPYFDKSMHFLYGLMFTVIGLILFYRVNEAQRRQLSVGPGFLAVYLIGFTMLCSFSWEIFEFTCDRLFGSDMQAWKAGGISGLTDTMLDLMADMLGTLLASILIARQLKQNARKFYSWFGAGFFDPGPPAR